jgi:dethiobiotin synthetase
MLKLFITATDTDAGKTYVAQALVNALVASGLKVAVYKPISAGCELIDGVRVNEDAQQLVVQANCQQDITHVNPIAFMPAIAPHIAAAIEEVEIGLADIAQGYQSILALQSDVIVCEGAGGWRLPLGKGKFLSEFVQASKQKVILVVNMKLGCLNHAMLTFETIIADGLTCIGWVANCQEDMAFQQENINELITLLPVPLLAELPFDSNIENAAGKFDLALLV